MNSYPTVLIYIDNDGDQVPETNISALVVSAISGQHGIFSAKETDRIATSGKISFDLENKDGAFSSAEDLIGKHVSIQLSFQTYTQQVFFGYITDCDIDSGVVLPLHVGVVVQDWLDSAMNTKVRLLQIQSFKTADQAMDILIDLAHNPPTSRDFETGTEVYQNVLDDATMNTRIYSEMSKVNNSEIGYAYLRFRQGGMGEELRFENARTRGATTPLSIIPSFQSSSYLRWRSPTDSGYLLHHSPTDEGKIILLETSEAAFSATGLGSSGSPVFSRSKWTSGRRTIVNEMTVSNIVRRIDTDDVLLYKLGNSVQLGTAQKYSLVADYTDPAGGTIIQGRDIVTPVSGVHYKFSENSDGTGTDLTANLLLNFSYGTNGFLAKFFNVGDPGYLWFFELYGRGIYKYNPIEQFVESVESKESLVMTEVSESLVREYSSDLVTSLLFARSVVALHKHPSQDLSEVTFQGNASEQLLLAFMFLEQGDKVQISEINPAHTGNYYIQGVKFKIGLGGEISYTWYLKEEVKTFCSPIIVDAPDDWENDAIDFGLVPHASNLPYFTWSFWLRRNITGAFGCVIGKSVDRSSEIGGGRRGYHFFFNGTLFDLRYYRTPTDGEFSTGAVISNLGVWNHVAILSPATTTETPQVYVNGVSVSVTVDGAPDGPIDNDDDCPLVLFNLNGNPATPEIPYYSGTNRFSLKDVRLYNRMLTPSEISELYSNENEYNNVMNGLLFHGLFAPNGPLEDYDGPLTSEHYILDAVYGVAGVPYIENPLDPLTGETTL